MDDRAVDRSAWANIVEDLIVHKTKGNKSEFVRAVGISYKTIQRWLNHEVEVSEESVRQVARSLGVSPLALLVQVGFYSPTEVGESTPNPSTDDDDPALRAILEADIPLQVKQRMIQRLQDLRGKDAARQVDEVRFWIDQASGA